LTKLIEKFETFEQKLQNNLPFNAERLYDNLCTKSGEELDLLVQCLLNTRLHIVVAIFELLRKEDKLEVIKILAVLFKSKLMVQYSVKLCLH
jgi:hypothetical protein